MQIKVAVYNKGVEKANVIFDGPQHGPRQLVRQKPHHLQHLLRHQVSAAVPFRWPGTSALEGDIAGGGGGGGYVEERLRKKGVNRVLIFM